MSSEFDKKAKPLSSQVHRPSRAPEPISLLRSMDRSTVQQRPQEPAKPIDWPFWLAMEDVRLWEASALSLGIDPKSLKISSTSWMARDGRVYFDAKSFENKEMQDLFESRRDLLTGRLHKFRSSHNLTLLNLPALSRWWPANLPSLPSALRDCGLGLDEGIVLVTDDRTPAPIDLPTHSNQVESDNQRMVEWRRYMVSHWPAMIEKFKRDPNAREVIKYLKTNEKNGCILNEGKADELFWQPVNGEKKRVAIKTIRNAIAENKAEKKDKT